MTIQLNPEQEHVVAQALETGLIRDLGDVAEVGIAAIRQKLKVQDAASGLLSTDDWFRELTAWSESHMQTPLLPDEALDRDSIYGARGL
jgi:hypothetical protein